MSEPISSPPFTGFANTFLVRGENGRDQPTLQVVGPAEDISRRKRPHRKSRLGCIRCKKRKVKCDEAYPCGNCVKRNETCVRHRPAVSVSAVSSPNVPIPPPPPTPKPLSPASGSCDSHINLLHMELLHHFERFTIPTLCFQEIWPTMLQRAFHSPQQTHLPNAILSLSAAHKAYLLPSSSSPTYHLATHHLLDTTLTSYRHALSLPITSTNCDALLSTAILVHHLMWCDLSFMDTPTNPHNSGLDLSTDRLYQLSTGVRQIFFMAWPLFQTGHSVFMRVPVLQPYMALEDNVDARGLNWRGLAQGFMELYDNPRYRGGRGAFSTVYGSPFSTTSSRMVSQSPGGGGGFSSSSSSTGQGVLFDSTSPGFQGDATPFGTDSLDGNRFKVATLWDSYKMGEVFVENPGQQDKILERAAYERLVTRLSVAIAFIEGRGAGFCPAAAPTPPDCARSALTQADIVRYVLTFPMLCFGPFLPLISSGDSRALVVLFHIYRVVRILLPTDEFWWCRRRAEVMEEAIGAELRVRGLEVCIRRQNEVV